MLHFVYEKFKLFVGCCVAFRNPSQLKAFYHEIAQEFSEGGGIVRVKNAYREDYDIERTYGYRTLMVNVLYDVGITYGDIASGDDKAKAKKNWDSHHIKETGLSPDKFHEKPLKKSSINTILDWMKSANVCSQNVKLVCEIQLCLDHYLQYRTMSHGIYKILRASDVSSLMQDCLPPGAQSYEYD